MIIILETLYTPYTLDTYNTFNIDDEEDSIIDDINTYDQETGVERDTPLNLSYDDIDWTYDMKGYRNALAENWLSIMNDNIVDDVILSIGSDCKVISPDYYNFTTDKIFADFTVNLEVLRSYIDANRDDYNENKIKSYDGFMWLGDEYQTMLNYYLRKVSAKLYTREAYYYDQVEGVPSSEYITYKIK